MLSMGLKSDRAYTYAPLNEIQGHIRAMASNALYWRTRNILENVSPLVSNQVMGVLDGVS